MATKSRPAKVPEPPSSAGTSNPTSDHDPAQLSALEGVHSSVSSVVIDRGVLAMAAAPSHRPADDETTLPGNGLSDAEVMLRVKTGDESAFAYLVQKHRRPLVSFMYRMARNSAVAEELVQEIFLRVYRSRATYNAEAKFSTWLYRIATNLAVNHARDTKHEKPELSVSLDEPDSDTGQKLDLADGTASAEQALLHALFFFLQVVLAIDRRAHIHAAEKIMILAGHGAEHRVGSQVLKVGLNHGRATGQHLDQPVFALDK